MIDQHHSGLVEQLGYARTGSSETIGQKLFWLPPQNAGMSITLCQRVLFLYFFFPLFFLSLRVSGEGMGAADFYLKIIVVG
jgi:hypothetical protein